MKIESEKDNRVRESVYCMHCDWTGTEPVLRSTDGRSPCPVCGGSVISDPPNTAPEPLSGKGLAGLTKERCLRLADMDDGSDIRAVSPEMLKALTQPPTPTGIEALVCRDIAARQQMGIAKYGRTVEESGDDMLQHAVEESYDLSVYLRAEIEKRKRRRCHAFDPLEVYLPEGWRLEESTSQDDLWIVHSPRETASGFNDRRDALEFICAEADRAEMERGR